ncbi:MAG: hypothetical protein BWY82_00652 [Verrucomicrobia bacterium ADurb.Bin474]|nr:MAG: hypothetical protein BWY82_00652 [Verrucomicrobia bacterium ADurb.Bin474]
MFIQNKRNLRDSGQYHISFLISVHHLHQWLITFSSADSRGFPQISGIDVSN